METVKWDGVSDAVAILEALLCFIDDDDLDIGKNKSYGDFGKDLQRQYKKSSAGNGNFSVVGGAQHLTVRLKKKGIEYELTWNKAAKLIHKHLHEGGRK